MKSLPRIRSTDVKDHPQLPVLGVLERALVQSVFALRAAHMDYGDDCPASEAASYAQAIALQARSLEQTLRCYRRAMQRLVRWRRELSELPYCRPPTEF